MAFFVKKNNLFLQEIEVCLSNVNSFKKGSLMLLIIEKLFPRREKGDV